MTIRIEFEDFPETGKKTIQKWRVWLEWRNFNKSRVWVLYTHDGCERVAGDTWKEAAQYINECATSYGGRLLQEVS